MKKFGLVVLLAALLLCAGVGIAGWYAYSQFTKGEFRMPSLFNSVTSTDLGITFTPEDSKIVHESLQSQAKAITSDSTECATINCTSGKAIYSGTQNATITLTNSQGTALINEWIQLSPNAPFTAAQMRVNQNGSIDFAGIVDMKQVQRFGVAGKVPEDTMQLITKYVGSLGETFPLTASGQLTINNNQVDANFSTVKIGIIPVPSNILTQYKGETDTFIEERLKVVQGLSIEELSFDNGQTIFKGTIPKTIYFVK